MDFIFSLEPQAAHSGMMMIGATVFLRQILPHSAVQFVKFRGTIIPKQGWRFKSLI